MTGFSPEKIQITHQAANLIKASRCTVVLTGAGISTHSGIPDFRSPGIGLWTRYLPMEVASLSTFRHNPELFYKWLHPLAVHMLSAEPNAAHIALAKLEAAGFISTIITQNIDGLHTRAGAKQVLEVHGTLNTLTCVGCYRQFSSFGIIEEYVNNGTIPYCQVCGAILKPDVILYEEQLPFKTWQKAEEASRTCELMLVVGTSLEVMPSAKLPVVALGNGARLIMVNKTDTYVDVRADVILRGDVVEFLPQLVDEVISE
jgi:NAD-dependent deacetylase